MRSQTFAFLLLYFGMTTTLLFGKPTTKNLLRRKSIVGEIRSGVGGTGAYSTVREDSDGAPSEPVRWGKGGAPRHSRSPRVIFYAGGSKSIGTYTNGCLKNGIQLSPEGIGYQSVLFSKQRLYGHPILIQYIKALAKKIHSFWKFSSEKETIHHKVKIKKSTWLLGIEDLSSQAGGPTTGNHNSHQIGLDADILFMPIRPGQSREEREQLHAVSMVNEDGTDTSEFWTKKQALLLRTAAQSPVVERIFINPVLKQALCKMTWEDRTWLRKIRPWNGHRSHFHVRLTCPKDSLPECKPQVPPPIGDGCGKELSAWFLPKEPLPAAPPPTSPAGVKPTGPKPPPEACQLFWAQSGLSPERKFVPLPPDQPNDGQDRAEIPKPVNLVSPPQPADSRGTDQNQLQEPEAQKKIEPAQELSTSTT